MTRKTLMMMTRRSTVNPTPQITTIEIMMTDDDAAETRTNRTIQWAAIPGTMACHATEDVMAIQETTGQMVGDSRAFSVPRRHHRPRRGTILSSIELQCRVSGSSFVFTLIHLGATLHYTCIFVLHKRNRIHKRKSDIVHHRVRAACMSC